MINIYLISVSITSLFILLDGKKYRDSNWGDLFFILCPIINTMYAGLAILMMLAVGICQLVIWFLRLIGVV